MKFIYSLFCILFSLTLKAQQRSFTFVGQALINGDFDAYYSRKADSSVKADGLRELEYMTYAKNKKGQLVLKERDVYAYFPSGHVKYSAEFNSKGRLNSYYYDSVDQQNRIVLEENIYRYHRRKNGFKTRYIYDGNGKIPQRIQSYSLKKDKPYMSTVNEFSGDILNRARVFHNGRSSASNTIEYIRDSSGKIRFVHNYNKRGKLISITNYTCNKTGQTEKKVDESIFCKSSEKLPNGHRIEIYVNQYSKYYTGREVREYDTQNRLIRQTVFYGKNGELLSYEYNIYFTDSGRLSEYKNYDIYRKKPVLVVSNSFLQKDNVNVSNLKVRYNRKGRKISEYSTVYHYDESKRVISTEYKDKITGKESVTRINRRFY